MNEIKRHGMKTKKIFSYLNKYLINILILNLTNTNVRMPVLCDMIN